MAWRQTHEFLKQSCQTNAQTVHAGKLVDGEEPCHVQSSRAASCTLLMALTTRENESTNNAKKNGCVHTMCYDLFMRQETLCGPFASVSWPNTQGWKSNTLHSLMRETCQPLCKAVARKIKKLRWHLNFTRLFQITGCNIFHSQLQGNSDLGQETGIVIRSRGDFEFGFTPGWEQLRIVPYSKLLRAAQNFTHLKI